MRHPREVVGGVEPAIERMQLGAQAVEPIENGIELAVAEVFSLHEPKFTEPRG